LIIARPIGKYGQTISFLSIGAELHRGAALGTPIDADNALHVAKLNLRTAIAPSETYCDANTIHD
jgi:hypothetical protein